jgi:hypothetical protein
MIDTQVQRGADMLDERMPGWYRHIDLDRLDIGSPTMCVCGQLSPARAEKKNWRDTLKILGIDSEEAGEYGFNTRYVFGTYEGCTAQWKTLIRERLDFDREVEELNAAEYSRAESAALRALVESEEFVPA